MKEKDIKSLEHTKRRGQYQSVFVPNYRQMTIYGETKKGIGEILKRLYAQKGVDIIKAGACPNHIHICC